MNTDRYVLLLAGTLTLVATLLTVLVSPWWALLGGFVGLNLIQSTFTGFCPAALLLRKLGVRSGAAFE